MQCRPGPRPECDNGPAGRSTPRSLLLRVPPGRTAGGGAAWALTIAGGGAARALTIAGGGFGVATPAARPGPVNGLAFAHGLVELVPREVVPVLAADGHDVAEAFEGKSPDRVVLIGEVDEALRGL